MSKVIKLTDKVRYNINLLDRPLFIVSNKLARGSAYTDDNGFTITTAKDRDDNLFGLPTMFDKKLLYFLMLEAQKMQTTELSYRSMYQLVTDMGLPVKADTYARVEEALKRLHLTRLVFRDGSYYDTKHKLKKYKSLYIIEVIELTSDEIFISLNRRFMRENEKLFTRHVSMTTIMKFTNPLALRLYELTSKIISSISWSISLDKFEAKIAVRYRNRRDATRSLDGAVRELNKKVPGYEEFRYTLTNKGLLTFFKK